ncbi:hypothetical protein CTA2_10863 [Colletotrichum tanaceti]|nr:hypothetical protein CTA2_10868 [Colletotrichum tanaceti]KAJ0165559.1 hypothetical protein CTA2_10863 [Colletotrichum tanaceti]
MDQIPLANAAKTAGLPRFAPCFFGTLMPGRGMLWLRDQSLCLNHVQKPLYLPYTVIDMTTSAGVPFRISRGSSPGPRTLRDHRVFAYTELLSQNDVYGLIERLSGSYRKSWGLRGDNTPEYARYLGYQMGIDLYHDLVGNSFEDFCEKASGWKAKPIYVKNRQAAIAAAAAATAAKNKDA